MKSFMWRHRCVEARGCEGRKCDRLHVGEHCKGVTCPGPPAVGGRSSHSVKKKKTACVVGGVEHDAI